MIGALRQCSRTNDSGLPWLWRVQLLAKGDFNEFVRSAVLPSVADAWFGVDSASFGNDTSFTCYIDTPKPARSLNKNCTDTLALERETEGLLGEYLGAGRQG